MAAKKGAPTANPKKEKAAKNMEKAPESLEKDDVLVSEEAPGEFETRGKTEKKEPLNRRDYLKLRDWTEVSSTIAAVLEEEAGGPMVNVRPEFLLEFRKAIGLSQQEMAQILGCTNISIHQWEQSGIGQVKGQGLATFKALEALFRYAVRFPEKIDPDELSFIVKRGAEKTLINRFLTRVDRVDPEVLSCINTGIFVGILMAVLVEVIEGDGSLRFSEPPKETKLKKAQRPEQKEKQTKDSDKKKTAEPEPEPSESYDF